MARVVSINISEKKGTIKKPTPEGYLRENHGLEGDAHAGDWHRQVSLLAQESIDKMKLKIPTLVPGAFAENITTEGIDLCSLPVGTKLKIGDEAILEITQIGKLCHTDCEIRVLTGDCVMPREGIFAKVVKGGKIKNGDAIEIL